MIFDPRRDSIFSINGRRVSKLKLASNQSLRTLSAPARAQQRSHFLPGWLACPPWRGRRRGFDARHGLASKKDVARRLRGSLLSRCRDRLAAADRGAGSTSIDLTHGNGATNATG
jgi:hypothetical protein